MANKIKIKRSLVTDVPGSLEYGEIAYSFASNVFFIGRDDNSVIPIGGKKYVDKINNMLPDGGSSGDILVNSGDGTAYWGTIDSGVTSVNGKTGNVTLDKSDVGLDNVDNTADNQKIVAKANKLTNPVAIAGIAFDGSSDIDIPLANLATDANHRAMTDDEKNKLSTVYNWYQLQVGNDNDNVVNTIKDVLDMMQNMAEGTDLAQQLTNPTNMTIDCGEF